MSSEVSNMKYHSCVVHTKGTNDINIIWTEVTAGHWSFSEWPSITGTECPLS